MSPSRRYHDNHRGLFVLLVDWLRWQLTRLPELPARIENWALRQVVPILGFAAMTVFWSLLAYCLWTPQP